MSVVNFEDSDVDIVIAALNSDLTSFMNDWRPIFSRFHLIIVKDPGLNEELKIPEGFNVDVYTKFHMDRAVGSSTSVLFSGYSCRYFGFLISRQKYIVSIDDDCVPAKDEKGFLIDAVDQHIKNLTTPATPFFFNTLYDPYREGADFVRGYPFSLRNGVTCALSCGLWLNLADLDAPTQALKPGQRNSRYVDAVMTVPARTMMPISGINIAFDREMVRSLIAAAASLFCVVQSERNSAIMLVYQDLLTGDELLSDSFPYKEIQNGMLWEVEGKWVVQGAVDVDIGANPSAEGADEDEGVDDQAVKVVDIVDTFRLQEQPSFDKKQFVTYMKRFIKLLTAKLDGEKQETFKKNIEAATKFLLSKLSDLQFFVGESMHDDGSLVFAYYKEGATDPTFLYFAYALKEVKC